MSCSQASIRYASDLSYRRRIDSGMSPEAIAADDALEAEAVHIPDARGADTRLSVPEAATVTVASSETPLEERPRPKRPTPPALVVEPVAVASVAPAKPAGKWAVRRVWVAFAPDGSMLGPFVDQPAGMAFVGEQLGLLPTATPEPKRRARKPKPAPKPRVVQGHGTNASYARGCRCDDCREANRAYGRAYIARRRAAGVDEGKHGTAYGYQLGCRSNCPVTPTCSDAALAAENRRRRDQGIEARDLVDAGPVQAHVRMLRQSMSWASIARRAGVPAASVRRLVDGRDDGDRRGEIPAQTERDKAERLLAVTA